MILVNQDNLVDLRDGCPRCGELRADYLVWQEDEEQVRCSSCGTLYQPDAKADPRAGGPTLPRPPQ